MPSVSSGDPLAWLDELQRVAHIGLWEWDIATNRVGWSSELYRIYDVEPSGFAGTYEAFLELVYPEDRPRVDAAVRAAFEKGESYAVDHRVTRRDGSLRTLHARGQAAKNEAGVVTRLIGTVQDVTELRNQEGRAIEADQLRETEKFRTEFISKAAHELRTPLLPIRVQLHLLRASLESQGDGMQMKSLAALERNLERLNRLVDELLEAARMQSARLKLDKRPFDLAGLLDEAFESFTPVASQLGLKFLWRPRPGLVVEADPQRILQVVHNLLGNAMKFTPTGGAVNLDVERHGPTVWIRIRDSGPGLGAEELQTLFQPFTQAQAARQNRAPGSGLGLYISKGIVEEHGGRIWAESGGPNQGASFIVELSLSGKQPEPVDVKLPASAWWQDAAPSERAQRLKELI